MQWSLLVTYSIVQQCVVEYVCVCVWVWGSRYLGVGTLGVYSWCVGVGMGVCLCVCGTRVGVFYITVYLVTKEV